MAKIKITESELKQVIMENVLGVLKEGMQEGQASRFQRRYDAYNQAAQNYNTDFAKDWSEMTEPEKAKWTQQAQAEFDKNKMKDATTPIPNPENFYNKQREIAQANTQRFLNKRGVGNVMQKQLADLYKELNVQDQNSALNSIKTLNTNLETANNNIVKIAQALKINTNTSPVIRLESKVNKRKNLLKEEDQNAGLVNDIITKIGEITKQAESVPGLRAQINRLNTTNNQLQATVNNYQKSAQLAKNQAMAQQGQAKIQTQPIPTARPLGNPTQNVNPNVNA